MDPGRMKNEHVARGEGPHLGDLPLAYRPKPGVRDEMVDGNGLVRAPWRNLIRTLSASGPHELGERFARAERYLRDAGIHQRDYGGGPSARPWPLSPFPVLLSEEEWSGIAAGLAERATLLESVMADVYGENRLVAEGLFPPAAIAGNPRFLRPLVHVPPRGGHFLHFLAFDLVRDPAGRWTVLADRTEAPSAAGFVLENRIATNRAFAGLYDRSTVERLAPFFASFRDGLRAHLGDNDERVAVLTPGRQDPTYFEQAYLARYLGFTLLEGEDLTVVDGELLVRTISGPKPVTVLWRRLMGNRADPLELDENGLAGTPGLVEAVRAGAVTMVNALGSGLLETGIVAAHLPAIARHLLGREPLLPAAHPVWGGAGAAVTEGKHLIGPALSGLPVFERNSGFRKAEGQSLAGDPSAVAYPLLDLSYTPVFEQGMLISRPLIVRAYAARTAGGFRIMPGGFARTAAGEEGDLLAFHEGGRSADLWIVGSRPVPAISLITAAEQRPVLRQAGNLPGRAADNLFWLGRYIERAEGALRILRAYHARLAENGHAELPLLASLTAYLAELEIDTAQPVPDMLIANIDSAVYSAGNLRDRFSPDGWLALTDLQKTAHRFREKVAAGDDAAHAMTVLLRKLAGFAGLVHENMYRFMGWRFLTIGRHLERGLHMTLLLAHFTHPDAPEGADDLLLDIGDNVMTHRRHYSVDTTRTSVIDLMGLDPYNPRSVLFQITEIARSVRQLPNSEESRMRLRADMDRLEGALAKEAAGSIEWSRFKTLEAELEAFSDALALAYLT